MGKKKYKPKYADPDEYKRILVKDGKPFEDNRYEQWEWERYFRKYGVYNREQFEQFKKDLDERFKKAESSIWKKLFAKLWFHFCAPKIEELMKDPKKVFYLLSKLDLVAAGLPKGYWTGILLLIDKVAGFIYEQMDKE